METNDLFKLKEVLKRRKFFFKETVTENYDVLEMDNGDTLIDFLFSKVKGTLINIRENKVL